VLTGFADPKPARESLDYIVLGRSRTTDILAAGADRRRPVPPALERRLAGVLARRL